MLPTQSQDGLIRAGRSDKYGQVYVERIGNTGFPDPAEPVALLRGQDRLAYQAMLYYKALVDRTYGVPEEQRQSVAAQVYAMQVFQIANPDKVRIPGTPGECQSGHDFQCHPESDDFGVCSRCGAEEHR